MFAVDTTNKRRGLESFVDCPGSFVVDDGAGGEDAAIREASRMEASKVCAGGSPRTAASWHNIPCLRTGMLLCALASAHQELLAGHLTL
ncbi:hypothetical protein CC86DRAFT_373519 [Ophiobolus disseminans]|uniref:Uncharacterized protein n=1 Tax=Ophiobolus disseminans TaxID=1469910 RepID=A0A6A6ZLG2_9PLEO|nr:hypothetical protein CC86DRAFT_373519 [Ophiobolus disseminans]